MYRFFFRLSRIAAIVGLLAANCLVYGEADSSYELNNLIAEIHKAGAPVIKGDYLIFTADAKPRSVGIVFDFENFRTIHSLRRIDTQDMDYKVINSFYFYVLDIPDTSDSISYKLIIDGLWVADPLNPNTRYDRTAGMLSTVKIPRNAAPVTAVKYGIASFVYYGESGKRIRLSGSFTNWDPYIYELRETSPGIYELEIPLPKGTYYYQFIKGVSEFVDPTNPSRVHSPDGRSASVLKVD
jgi:hypothetical protein